MAKVKQRCAPSVDDAQPSNSINKKKKGKNMFPKCWLSTLADKSIDSDGKMVSRQNPASHCYPCFRFSDRETSRPSFLTASIWFFSFGLIFVFLLQSLMQILLVASTLYSPFFFFFHFYFHLLLLSFEEHKTKQQRKNLHMEIMLRQNVFPSLKISFRNLRFSSGVTVSVCLMWND